MNWLPTLEYSLSHPYPKGHLFLIATIVIFSFTTPALVIVNLVTLGYDLVPSLQPRFQPNDTHLDGWWAARRLPRPLRPRPPPCEPRDLGRGDIFRLSASLFDYTVMSTWNTSEGAKPSGVQEQKRVEYRGESFASCYVNSARFDYSLVEQTESVIVGVLCPGYRQYPIEISMQTTITFAWMINKDFIGQYYGPGLDLINIDNANASDYRRVVLASLEVLSTDALIIMRRSSQHLSNPVLSTSIWFDVDPEKILPNPKISTLAYANGTIPDPYPYEATIYYDTIVNLVTVAVHAVNLDLGNHRPPNIFRDPSLLSIAVMPNSAPNFTDIRVNSSDWAEGSQAYYYGNLTAYQTWADSLLHGHPVSLHNLTELPGESVMVTSYLCPTYQIKPISSLLASVFVGSATMILSVWSVWMYFTTIVATQIMEPKVICYCSDCENRRVKEAEEAKIKDENPVIVETGFMSKVVAFIRALRRPSHTFSIGDAERVKSHHLAYEGTPRPILATYIFTPNDYHYRGGHITG